MVSELFPGFGYYTKAAKNIHINAFCAPKHSFLLGME